MARALLPRGEGCDLKGDHGGGRRGRWLLALIALRSVWVCLGLFLFWAWLGLHLFARGSG